MQESIMEKRDKKRIPVNREIIFFSDDSKRIGTLTNCSERGMYIKNTISSPFDYIYDVLIPLKKDILKVRVKVVRVDKTDYFYEGVGVELLDLPEAYLEFILNLESVMKLNQDGKF
jgi:hypothetical protein